MLFIVVLVFLITLTTSFTLYIIEGNREDTKQAVLEYLGRSSITWQVSNLVLLINSSVNMLIYCFKDKQFRNVAIQITRLDQVWRRQVTSEMPLEGKDARKDTESIAMLTE